MILGVREQLQFVKKYENQYNNLVKEYTELEAIAKLDYSFLDSLSDEQL